MKTTPLQAYLKLTMRYSTISERDKGWFAWIYVKGVFSDVSASGKTKAAAKDALLLKVTRIAGMRLRRGFGLPNLMLVKG